MLDEKNLKILVVDEFLVTRTILINQLRNLGFFKIVESEDGFSALARLKSALFDLVVSDLNMSDMSGLDLLKKIREDSDLKNLLSEGALNLDIVKGATFTRVTLNENGNSSELTVVGSPSLIESKIFTKKRRTLLKG